MTEKLVHVNSYTKDDGTHVKEHYRGGLVRSAAEQEPKEERPPLWDCTKVPYDGYNPLGDCMRNNDIIARFLKDIGIDRNQQNFIPQKGMTNNLVLEGGVSTTVGGGFDFSNIGSVLISAAMIAVNVGIEAAKIASKMKNASQNQINTLKPQFDNQISKIKQNQEISDLVEKMNLEKLVNTKDQKEYANLYETFTQQKELNATNKQSIQRIEYAAQNNDFDTVVNELNTYQDNYKNAANNLQKRKMYVDSRPNSAIDNSAPLPSPYYNAQTNPDWSKEAKDQAKIDFNEFKRTGMHDFPQFEKSVIDKGGDIIFPLKNSPDAKELWKAAAYNFKQSADYIKQNGYLVESVNHLSPKLKTIISNKLQQQIGVRDTKGIIFNPDSTLSKSIVDSTEFQKFLKDNINQMLKGQVINGSINFDITNNTHYSLGHTDIIDAYIDAKGNFNAKVIDTYDFNENDPDWKVEWARNVQEKGMMTNFYTINIIFIPAKEWVKLIN